MGGSDIFDYCVGGLSLLSAVISAILFDRTYLPGVRMRLLDELLDETRGIYEKADAGGSLPPHKLTRSIMYAKLVNLENSTATLREATYKATSTFKEVRALISGLSGSIMRKTSAVKEFRATLVVNCSRRAETPIWTSWTWTTSRHHHSVFYHPHCSCE